VSDNPSRKTTSLKAVAIVGGVPGKMNLSENGCNGAMYLEKDPARRVACGATNPFEMISAVPVGF